MASQREDGRESHQVRAPAFEGGLLHRADGSARVTVGHTMAMAAVFGPGPGRARAGERPDCLTIEVVLGGSSSGGPAGVSEEKIATYRAAVLDVLKSTVRLTAYPRCALVVALRVLRDDGGTLAALINATAAALMDAGVEMRAMPVGSSFCWDKARKGLVVDPTLAEERSLDAVATIACMATTPCSVLSVHATGDIDDAMLPACFEAAAEVAQTYGQIARASAGQIP